MSLKMAWRKNWPDLHALLRGGFSAFIWQRNPEVISEGIPVFYYHKADPDTVAADFQFLQMNGYQTLTAEALCDSGTVPPRSIFLTVDDGAHDLYRVLYPALKQHGFHAMAFVATAFHKDHYDLPDTARPCTWQELREMEQAGVVDVQAHTHTHRYLPRWPEPLDLVGIDTAYTRRIQQREAPPPRDDFAAAKSLIEDRLGKRVSHLAFPMYRGTAEAVEIAQALGFEALWWGTLPRRPLYRPGDSLLRIPRLSAEFIRRLPGSGRLDLASVIRRRWCREPVRGTLPTANDPGSRAD